MKVMQEGKGEQRKRSPTLPGAGSEWDETMDRLCRKLFETYHLEPAGGLINPEVAFAAIRKFVKEDLHRSVRNFFYRDRGRHLMNLSTWQ